jgi:uncharacterized protein (PEP-CTERM system associated)
MAVPVFAFTTAPGLSIHDLTWSFGGTWTPSPASSLTLSYGHLNGFDAFSANGYYRATPRTVFTVSYGSTLGTQLQYLQNQLNLAAPNGNGGLVNSLNGGTLFGATNALAVRDGVFRTDTLTVGSRTILDRDIISLNLLLSNETTTTGATAASGTSKSANATWLHSMQPDMTLSAAIYVALQDQAFANARSVVASLAWQYHLSDTLAVSARYSFLEQRSQTAIYNFNQNILILGITKTF